MMLLNMRIHNRYEREHPEKRRAGMYRFFGKMIARCRDKHYRRRLVTAPTGSGNAAVRGYVINLPYLAGRRSTCPATTAARRWNRLHACNGLSIDVNIFELRTQRAKATGTRTRSPHPIFLRFSCTGTCIRPRLPGWGTADRSMRHGSVFRKAGATWKSPPFAWDRSWSIATWQRWKRAVPA